MIDTDKGLKELVSWIITKKIITRLVEGEEINISTIEDYISESLGIIKTAIADTEKKLAIKHSGVV